MTNSQHRRPLWIGFTASVLTAPVIFAGVSAVMGGQFIASIFLLFGLGTTILSTIGVVIPLVYWLRKNENLFSKYLYLASIFVGALGMGLATFTLNYAPQVEREGYFMSVVFGAIPTMLPGSVLGLLSALAFCVGAGVRLNPFRK